MTRTSSSTGATAIATPVWRAIENASHRTGVDFDYLLDQARIESGFRPDARAGTSSAAGLYQFTTQTWLATLKRHGAAHGYGQAADAIEPDGRGIYRIASPAMRDAIWNLRIDPTAAALMAGELASDNHAHMGEALGRSPEQVDLYLAHFLGAAGATKFLRAWAVDPGQPAAPLFPKAADANPSVFFGVNGAAHSLADIRRSFARKLADDDGLMQAQESGTRTIQFAAVASGQTALKLHAIEPMPKTLSLDFARNAYRKLASLSGTAA